MSTVTDPILLDRTGQDISAKLQRIADAINGGTIDPLTVATNGVYTPSGQTIGYGPVTVNVPTGMPILTRAQWNALTTEQKQSYGYIAVQDSDSGFIRGSLYYGADYVEIRKFLPASNPDDILCDAYVANFDPDKTVWGLGDNPITLQTGLLPTIDQTENAVLLNILQSGKFAYVDLGAEGAQYTVYAVMRLISPGSYTRLLSSMESRVAGRGMLLYGSEIKVSSWANDTSTGAYSANYNAVALQYRPTLGAGAGMVSHNGSYIVKTPAISSQYLAIGRTDINPDAANAEPANLYLRYLGVSSAYETETQIRANLANLESEFIA